MLSRREMLTSSAGAALAAPGIVTTAWSEETWPTREIRAICMFPPGTGADIYVRFFARKLQEARLSGTAIKDEHFDWEAETVAYADAFREYGLDVDGLDPQEEAEQIRLVLEERKEKLATK